MRSLAAAQCAQLRLLQAAWARSGAAAAAWPGAPAAAAAAAAVAAGGSSGWPGASPAGCKASSSAAGAQADGSWRLYEASFNSPPQPLTFARGGVVYPPQLEGNPLGRLLLRAMGAYSRSQQLRNGAAVLYQAITEAAEDEALQRALGLEPARFMTPHTLLSLHMWLVFNRLHQEPDDKELRMFQQALYSEYYFKDVERRVFKHGVTIHVSKWMKKLEQQFYGSCVAYDRALADEGGVPPQQALVAPLLKNVYDSDEARRPWAQLAARYLSRELRCLHTTPLEDVLRGHVRFSPDVVTAPAAAGKP